MLKMEVNLAEATAARPSTVMLYFMVAIEGNSERMMHDESECETCSRQKTSKERKQIDDWRWSVRREIIDGKGW